MQVCLKCKEGKHGSDFALNQKWCKKCKASYYLKNKERVASKSKENYAKNKSLYIERAKRRYANKKDIILLALKVQYKNAPLENKTLKVLRAKIFDKNNPHKAAARCALRRARILQATPKWVDSTELKKIQSVYLEAKNLSVSTGEKYHVDHVIPLKGRKVCGLHVYANLKAIPAKINVRKVNTFNVEVETSVC